MSVKLVMGVQRDSLEGIKKFGGHGGTVVFPHLLAELENALRFEMGEVGVRIVRNKFLMNTIYRGMRAADVSGVGLHWLRRS